MSERKLLSYILITAFLGAGIGLGFYLYFVGNPLQRFSIAEPTVIPVEQSPAPTTIPTATPSPIEPELLQEQATIVGIINAIDGRTLTVQSQDTSLPYFVPEETKIYRIRTDVLSDPPLTEKITLEQVKTGNSISIYLNADESVRAIFIVE